MRRNCHPDFELRPCRMDQSILFWLVNAQRQQIVATRLPIITMLISRRALVSRPSFHNQWAVLPASEDRRRSLVMRDKQRAIWNESRTARCMMLLAVVGG